MEKKQTALEFYREELNALVSFRKTKFKTEQEIFKQAKAMRKEEIIKANRDGVDMVIDKKPYAAGEDYYNETYGGTE